MDLAARRLGLDPVELRRRNLLKPGDRMATGQKVTEALDLEGLMDRALDDLDFHRKREAFTRRNVSDGTVKKGVGLAVFMHGCGFTGSGEKNLASVTGAATRPDGRVEVLAASTEMGQGKGTVFSQIAAEALGVPLDLVAMAPADTRVVPNSGPTVASRSTMVVGRLVQDAALNLRRVLVRQGYLIEPHDAAGFRAAVRRAHEAEHGLTCYAQYQQPPGWSGTTPPTGATPTPPTPGPATRPK